MVLDQQEEIGPVVAKPGQPLYESVKQALIEAISTGHYQPGKRMPSTKEISRQMAVSLVTAHRALQELVTVGVLERTRGRGTYVVENHHEARPRLRVGVVLHQEASLSDFYLSQILEGMHRAAVEHRVDLLLLGFDGDTRQDAHAYVLINPDPQRLDTLADKVADKVPTIVVGASSGRDGVASVDTDHQDLAGQAVNHLYHLGHRRIGYLAGGGHFGNSQDRLSGFVRACKSLGIAEKDRPVVEVPGWRLGSDDKLKLNRMLGEEGLTAVFTGGYYLALDVYQAASMLGLKIPQSLTVVAVDDPPSASHLRPPLTTLRQPLMQIGHTAITAVRKALEHDQQKPKNEVFRAELVIRRSSGAPRNND